MSTHFEVVEIKEGNDRFDIRREEFKKLILSDLINCKSQIGLDGFCKGPSYNPLHQAEKPFFLQVFRGRWKSSDDKKHFSNTYDLHSQGVKATHEFAVFFERRTWIYTRTALRLYPIFVALNVINYIVDLKIF